MKILIILLMSVLTSCAVKVTPTFSTGIKSQGIVNFRYTEPEGFKIAAPVNDQIADAKCQDWGYSYAKNTHDGHSECASFDYFSVQCTMRIVVIKYKCHS